MAEVESGTKVGRHLAPIALVCLAAIPDRFRDHSLLSLPIFQGAVVIPAMGFSGDRHYFSE